MNTLAKVEIGVGTSSWGESLTWGFGKGYGAQDLREAFQEIIAHPNILIDTAEIYGRGDSESYIGQFNERLAGDTQPLIATKFFPFPWRLAGSSLLAALRASLQRLNIAQVLLYQVHWPLPPRGGAAWMEPLVQAAETGLTRQIGVSNYNTDQLLAAQSILGRSGLNLASNQVRYNLLDRRIEYRGMLDLCADLGIRVIAYSPLAQGLLTGKYTPGNPPPGIRGFRYRQLLSAAEPLISMMRQIGRAYQVDGIVKTPAQVALNWCMCKGALPIPGAKNMRQVQLNIGATGWRLAPEEINILDRLSDEFHQATRQ